MLARSRGGAFHNVAQDGIFVVDAGMEELHGSHMMILPVDVSG